jgi:formiminotetrahydrofolate cyclodeaminase
VEGGRPTVAVFSVGRGGSAGTVRVAGPRPSSYCGAMELVDRTLAEVIDRFAAREPAPGGGSAAALAGALAAALTEMSAAFALTPPRSAQDVDAGGGGGLVGGGGAGLVGGGGAGSAAGVDAALVAGGAAPVADAVLAGLQARLVEVRDRAHELRGELLWLAEDDTRSYAPVLDALAIERADPERPARLQTALSAAADVPLAIAVATAEVGELAFAAAQAGNADLLGDATVAAVIAEAAARSAARLVELNLAACPQDARVGRAEAAAQRARSARTAVLGGNDAQDAVGGGT